MISARFDQPVASMVWLIRASFLTGMTKLTIRIGVDEAARAHVRRVLPATGAGSINWTSMVRFRQLRC